MFSGSFQVGTIEQNTKMLRISALNEELSEESSGVDEPIVPTKEIEVSSVRIINHNLNFNIFFLLGGRISQFI